MQVDSKVILYQGVIDQLTQAAIRALEQTGDEVLTQVVEAQVVPFGDSFERGGKTHQGGTLQESGYVNTKQLSNGEVQVTFNTPYARRLFYHPEYNFRKQDNPNAKGRWLDDWAEGGKYAKEVEQAYAYFFKQLGGL